MRTVVILVTVLLTFSVAQGQRVREKISNDATGGRGQIDEKRCRWCVMVSQFI